MDKKQPTKRRKPAQSAKQQPKPEQKSLVRLNKFIADAGVCSRRKADELIQEGKVRVNGKTVSEFGMQVNPHTDSIFVNNKPVKPVSEKVYLLFNKPAQVMTTMSDPQGRPTVADYVEHLPYRVFPVGRLDWDTEGLLLLTNDGDFANKVMHPKHGIAKTYIVKLNGQPSDDHLRKLRQGVTIEGGRARALVAEKLKGRGSDQYDWIKIVIDEGRNRQVRRMIEKIGFDVKKLQRVAIGRLTMGDLERGEMRELSLKDIMRIFMTDEDVARREEAKKEARRPKAFKEARDAVRAQSRPDGGKPDSRFAPRKPGKGKPDHHSTEPGDESHKHPMRRTGARFGGPKKRSSYNPNYKSKGGSGGRARGGTRG